MEGNYEFKWPDMEDLLLHIDAEVDPLEEGILRRDLVAGHVVVHDPEGVHILDHALVQGLKVRVHVEDHIPVPDLVLDHDDLFLPFGNSLFCNSILMGHFY